MTSEANRQRAWLDARDALLEVQQRLLEGNASPGDVNAAEENLRCTEAELHG